MSQPIPGCVFPWRVFLLVMLVALIARALLLASNIVSFHSDEAIVGLMAQHILQGERPTFFYGQAYMGSLDAGLVAIGFSLVGESVLTIRIVQSVLFLLVVATGFLVVWRLSGRVPIATVAGLVLAVPSVDVALYTTATLGGYNEVMLLGNLILLFGYDVTHEHRRSAWRWAALGACAGLGWWVNGLIVIYALPVGILMLVRLARTRHAVSLHVPYGFLAILCFVLFSAPWWVFDFSHDHAALATFLTNRQSGEFEGIGIPYVPPEQRALGLLFIGLPTLLGLKFPWEASYFWLPIGVAVLLIYGIAIVRLLRGDNPLKPDARGLMLGMIGLFCIVFVASTFGADPTGRYLVVLALPFGIVLGTLAAGSPEAKAIWLKEEPVSPLKGLKNMQPNHSPFSGPGFLSAGRLKPPATLAFVLIILAYHAAGQVAAASSPTGITTQFDLVSHLPNTHDAELIAFLDDQGVYHGYTNYWVAFRLAFLSGERMQFSAALPYKRDLSYNAADNRYHPYLEATEQAERIAYITTNLPELDAQLEADWAAQGVTYQETRIGVFRVFYDFMPGLPELPAFSSHKKLPATSLSPHWRRRPREIAQPFQHPAAHVYRVQAARERHVHNVRPVARPGRRRVRDEIARQPARPAAIHFHHVDFTVAIPVGDEGDLLAVGRPGGLPFLGAVERNLAQIAAIGVDNEDF